VHLRNVVDDPWLLFALFVLSGIRDVEQRLGWVQTQLPRTAAMLGLSVDWEGLSSELPDGSGGMFRGPTRAA
jgi:hypothetical protein